NMDVNQWWICDRGRGQFHNVHDVVRVVEPTRREKGAARTASWTEAITEIASGIRETIARHGEDAVGVIASAELTNEELFLIRRVFQDGLKLQNLDFPARPQPPVVYPKFTIEGDKNPNTRGAKLFLSPNGGPAKGRSVENILAAAADGRIKTLLFFRAGAPELFGDAKTVARALQRTPLVAVVDFVASPISDLAGWVLPGVSHFERDGTYINSKGRVQRARKAFTLRGDTREDWRVIQELGQALGVLPETDPSPESIFDRIARTVPAFAGLSYTALGDLGAPLPSESANVAVG
ncbi:MAG TPA: molybdopterin-dependent oxidoreductase, partial [Candidatus Eisenbacteria bacterium]|nr:molybdopterin-dependent oxidoreductase [Candidatus Eisenbacteria bacterium]